MKDLEIHLENRPGALADMGEALGKASISIEGGGAWTVGDKGIAHFLVDDPTKARNILTKVGIMVAAENDVIVLRLKQDKPGQLVKITRLMQQAGVNIKVLYSDHYNQLILVVDDYAKGKTISENWTNGKYE
jgi:hypothetical protein